MGNKRLPPGFRFHPTDVELVRYYLKRKVLGKKLHFEVIAELDIYKYAPWDLPDRSLMRTGDLKWYFFCPREKKYSSGSRTNRATKLGYWKTTGNDRTVHYKDEIVGKVKTLVFHRGKAPKGVRTDWVMYEYRLEEKDLLDRGVAQDAYVLCSIFKKDGPGPRNGAQYGAPFNEEDWDDDDVDGVEVVNVTEAVSCADMPAPTQPNNQNQSIVASLLSPEALPSTSNSVAVVADDQVASSEPLQGSIENDDIFAMLENFTVDSPSAIAPNDANEVDTLNQGEMAHNHNHVGNNEAAPLSDGFDIYEDLGDLGNLPGYNKPQGIISICHDIAYSMEEKFGAGNGGFLELMDLDDPLSCCSAGGYEIVQSDLHHIANHSSSVELVSGSSEFRMGDSFVENGNQGSFNFQASALPNTSANFCQTSEMGSGQTTEPIRRGEEQRNTFSILQYHLESVEDLMEVKRWKCRIFMSHDLGSSLRVKAEVTFRTRSTKDALSEKLEESLCITYGVCNLSKQEYLRFLIFICGMICPFLSDSQLVSYIFGSSDGTCSIVDAIIFYQLLDSLFWVKEVNWNFNSSVNNDMHLKFVMILHSLHFSV